MPLTAFWDSSALVPLCLREASTQMARELLRDAVPVVWWASSVEISSAIMRSARSHSIDAQEARNAAASLNRLRSIWQEVSPTYELRETACDMLARYPLRGADSLQLAAALTWCQARPAGRNFICGDQRLSEAARSAGFAVLDL